MSQRRVYETTIIVNAALEDNDINAVVSKVTGYIDNHGGNIEEINKWGRRRLAYPINKKYNGFYVHIIFETMPNTVPILERFLELEDTILRHLTLQLSDKLREFRRKRDLEGNKPVYTEDIEEESNKRNRSNERNEESESEESETETTEEENEVSEKES